MSIIHDALKKAQQQGKQNAPDVSYNPPEIKKKPRVVLIGVIAAFAVAVIAYLYVPAFHRPKIPPAPLPKAAGPAPAAATRVDAPQAPVGTQVKGPDAPAVLAAAKTDGKQGTGKEQPVERRVSPAKNTPQPKTAQIPVVTKSETPGAAKYPQASGSGREYVRRAGRPAPDAGQKRAVEEPRDEEQVRRIVVRKTEDERLQTRYNEALSAMNSGRSREAQKMFLSIIAGRPDHVESLNGLGVIAASQGNRKEALGYFKKILDYRTDYPKAYNNIGLVMMSEGDVQLAEEYFRKAISLDPNGLEPYMNLCALLRSQGKFQEAAKVLDVPIKKNTRDPLILLSYAVIKDNLGQTSEAAKYYRSYLSLAKPSETRNGVLERLKYLEEKTRK